jgi:hypothetical protein
LFGTVRIDVLFDVRQQIRAILNFVEYDRWEIEFEKAPWIIHSGSPNVRELQRDISMRGFEELLQKGRFSGLPWASEHDGRELAASSFQNRLKRSGKE